MTNSIARGIEIPKELHNRPKASMLEMDRQYNPLQIRKVKKKTHWLHILKLWARMFLASPGWYFVVTEFNPHKLVYWTGHRFEDRVRKVDFMSIHRIKYRHKE